MHDHSFAYLIKHMQSRTDATTRDVAATYDTLPMISQPWRHSHPDHIAALASLFGQTPARPDSCRLLEIGCGTGGNLIPMAVGLPGSDFVGVDLSAVQVRAARSMAAALALDNIDFQDRDLTTLGDEIGEFDYIVAHGVFSWVPAAVQDRIFALCRRHLRRDGIAYISHNTLPGWRQRQVAREAMLFHVRHIDDPRARIHAGLDFLRTLEKENMDARCGYRQVLKQEIGLLEQQPDFYIAHDMFEIHNTPLYFRDFAARADGHGLQYLSEANLGATVLDNYPRETARLAAASGDVIEAEQYLDFVSNRTFRQTLLCHRERDIDRYLTADRIAGFHIAGKLRLDPAADAVRFVGENGRDVVADSPLIAAALGYLTEIWPRTVPFGTLLRTAAARVGAAPAEHDGIQLQNTLLLARTRNLIELSLCPPELGDGSARRPLASRLAALQERLGFVVTNLRHDVAALGDGPALRLLPLLDGRRDRQELLAAMGDAADPAAALSAALKELAEHALLAA